ncbi:DUF2069 domain-containing protein [Rhodoferax sp.]|uniref:DUF2069 domain-containing protein n=1 Tax=Rhodoferax sp. TaxID=50421 RepID=UPI00272FA5C2|nr:DUF2069 domain-containing protein [Rhodoferax sp.]MDP1528934.1 DUF2069 domain-containing protein [Rhodoferax sp.]MDP1943620.1 DUF2069 domain-containing protein [Rhodoferax sp.]MDP2440943.1 DUF2069 domain-containing protein [Rhodoferax sp.]MDZ4207658.1 DUF2069 domain-containing protein [Rhodoferax sp.]
MNTIPNAPPTSATPSVALTRILAVGSLLGLIVLGLAWELLLAPLRPGGSWLALKVLPLCLPLAGLLKNRMYTYRWVSLLVWLYFTEGAVRAYSDKPPGNYLAMVEVFLCLTLFTACALHVRLRLKNAATAASHAAPAL